MADFAAVLRKTLEGLGDTTPAMRERVYDKARSTIATKLAALNPPPPPPVAERQRQALEAAIASVESSFAPAPPGDPLDELESVFSSINAQRESPPPLRRPVPAPPPETPGRRSADLADARAPAPEPVAPAVSRPAVSLAAPRPAPAAQVPVAERRRPEPQLPPEPEKLDDEPSLDRLTAQEAPILHEPDQWDEPRAKKRRGAGGLVAAVLAIAVLGGGAYAAWLNADEVERLTGIAVPFRQAEQAPAVQASVPADTSAGTEEGTDAGEDAAGAPGETQPADQDAAAEPAEAPATDAAAAPKFTQRLDSSGSETDAGAAGGQLTVGEGTSVAQLTPPAADGGGARPADAQPAQGATPPATDPAPAAVAVGQRAIFYEERTTAAPGSAETGSIVWSTVQESPGGDLPPEAAIRAEATIPGKDMQLRLTIRRNADRTLPASHIIEMIFLSPNSTGPEAIDNVLRVSMKGTEQDPGSPLLGNSAKIADGYFLVALDDGTGQAAANLALLRQQDWIDIPVVYKSGRRALFTMEKGLPGEKVFNDALAAWQRNGNG